MADSLGFAVKVTADSTDFKKGIDDAAAAVEKQSKRAVKALKDQKDAYGVLRDEQGRIVEGLSKWQRALGYFVDELGTVRTANGRLVDGLTTVQKKIGLEVDELGNIYNRTGEIVGNTGKGLKEFADAEKTTAAGARDLQSALEAALNNTFGDSVEKMQRDLLSMSGAFENVKGGFDALLGSGNALSSTIDVVGKLSKAVVGFRQSGEAIGQALTTVKDFAKQLSVVNANGVKAAKTSQALAQGMGGVAAGAKGASVAAGGLVASLAGLATGIGVAVAAATILDKVMKHFGGQVVFDEEKQRAAQEYADKIKAIESAAIAAGGKLENLSDVLKHGALSEDDSTALDKALSDWKETLQRGFSTASRQEVEQEWQILGDSMTEGLAKFLDKITGSETEKIEQERDALWGMINERIERATRVEKSESEKTAELLHDLRRSVGLLDDQDQIKKVNEAIARLTGEYEKQVAQEQASAKQEILKQAGLEKYIKAQDAAAVSLDNARAKAAEWYQLANSGKISWNEYREAITNARDELRGQLKSATGYDFEQVDKTTETLANLQKALYAGVISQDEYNKALAHMKETATKTAAQELATAQGLDLDAAEKLKKQQKTTAEKLKEWADKLAAGEVTQEQYNKAAAALAQATLDRVKQLEKETGVTVEGTQTEQEKPTNPIARQLQENQEKWRKLLEAGEITQEQYNKAAQGLADQAKKAYEDSKTENDEKKKAEKAYQARLKELAELFAAGVIDEKERQRQEREARKTRDEAQKANDPAAQAAAQNAQSALSSLRQQYQETKEENTWQTALKAQLDAVIEAHKKGLATQAEVHEAEMLYAKIKKKRTQQEEAEAQRAARDAARSELGVDSIMESLKTPLQKFNETIAKLNDAAGFLSMEEYAAVYQKAIKDFQDANKTALDSGGGAGGGKAEKMKAGASMTAGSDTFYKALVESMSPGNYETTMKETTKRIFDATTHGNTLAQEGNAYLLQMAQAMNGFGNIGVFGG